MNLKELANIEEAIGKLEAQFDAETLTESQIEHVNKEIQKLEDRKEKLLGIDAIPHRTPWYDENY